MPVQPLEIEDARAQTEDPDSERARHDARRTCNGRNRLTVDERLADRSQNHVDARHLSRQRLKRKHALAVPTATTSRKRHIQNHRRAERVEPTLDSAPSKAQVAPATRRTPTAREQPVSRCLDDCGVLARLDGEYEDHVL